MRAISKILDLATEYKRWHDGLEKNNHPTYASSSHKYYYSIVANLLHAQGGLCAYTEVALCPPDVVAPDKWENGSFKKFDFMGQLDHYDPRLKEKNGWLWDNFFMIHTDINIKEKRSNIAQILKPDVPDFDITKYLSYNYKEDFFYPKYDLTGTLQETLLNDIEYLGLNHGTIVFLRKMTLKPLLEKIKYNAITQDEAKNQLFQFFTAYEMALVKLFEED